MDHGQAASFLSGPLDNDGLEGSKTSLPPGYNPPSLWRLKSHFNYPGVYHGFFENGAPHGFGTAVWQHRRKYEGQWVAGKEQGMGRESWLTGACYSGNFQEGLRSGYGIYVHCAEPEAIQELKISGSDGVGSKEYPWSGSSVYSRRWPASALGWAYVGQFKHGGRHGFGAMATSDGVLWEGQFQADKKHGFGMKLVKDEELWIEAWDQGECKKSWNPTEEKPLTLPVEVSFNRLRWSAAKMTISKTVGGQVELSFTQKESGVPVGHRITVQQMLSLKVGDPITHSFIVQYRQDDGVKRSVEVQAGSDAIFRLVFLVLRMVLHQHRTGVAPKRPFSPFWFKKLLNPLEKASQGRFIRGSEGLDERFIQKVRDCVLRSEREHMAAFNYTISSYLRSTASLSNEMVKSWGVAISDSFQVKPEDLPDPATFLQEAQEISVNSKYDPETVEDATFASPGVSATLIEDAISFLRRCDDHLQIHIDQCTKKRDSSLEASDSSRADVHHSRVVALQSKQRWVRAVIPVLEQNALHAQNEGRNCWALHFVSYEEIIAARDALKPVPRRKKGEEDDEGKSEMDYDQFKTISAVRAEEAGGVQRHRPPDMDDGIDSIKSPEEGSGFVLKRSAMTTALLLQSKRQRETLDLEYAEAEKLLKQAKSHFEQSQAAQAAQMQQMAERAEASEKEAEHFKLKTLTLEEEGRELAKLTEHLSKYIEAFRGSLLVKEDKRNGRKLLAAYFQTWQANTHLTLRWSRVSDKIFGKSRRTLLTTCLETWHNTVREFARHHFSAHKIMARWANSTIFKAFHRWHELKANSVRLRRKAEKVVQTWQAGSVGRALRQWTAYTQKVTNSRMIMNKIIGRWRNLTLSEAFEKWDLIVPSHNLQTQLELTQKEKSTMHESSILDRGTIEEYKKENHDLLQRILRLEELYEQSQAELRTLNGQTSDLSERLKAAASKILGRWMHRSLAAAFRWWDSHVRHGNTLKHKSAKILSRWLKFGLWNAFNTWSSHAKQLGESRRVVLKVMKHWVQGCLARAMTTWKSVLEEKRRHDRVMSSIVRRWGNLTLSKIFEAWREHSFVGRAHDQLKHSSLMKWLKGSLAKCFATWHAHAALLAHQRSVLVRVIYRIQSRSVVIAFNTWHGNVAHINHARQVLEKVVIRIHNRFVSMGFNTWSANAAYLRHAREVLNKVLTHMMKKSLAAAFEKWHSTLAYLSHAREVLNKVLAHMTKKSLAAAFEKWHSTVDVVSRSRNVLERVIMRMQNRSLSAAYETWHSAIVWAVQSRKVLNKVFARLKNRTLSSAFESWHVNVSQIKNSQRILSKTILKMLHKTLTMGWNMLRDNARHNALLKLKYTKVWTKGRKELLNKYTKRWLAFVNKRHQHKLIFVKILFRWQKQGIGATFWAWHHEVIENNRLLRSAKKIVLRWTHRDLSSAFDSWHYYKQNSNAPTVLFEKLAIQLLARYNYSVPLHWFAQSTELLSRKIRSKFESASLKQVSIIASPPVDPNWDSIRVELTKSMTPRTPIATMLLPPEVPTMGPGLIRFRKAVRSVIMARRFQAAACKVGISITNEPPHTVLSITELMDQLGKLQGDPGYQNPIMKVGDVLRYINGKCVDDLPIGGVKDALFGPPNSTVLLKLQRPNGSLYEVRAMRHMAVTRAGTAALEKRVADFRSQHSPPDKQAHRDENPLWNALQSIAAVATGQSPPPQTRTVSASRSPPQAVQYTNQPRGSMSVLGPGGIYHTPPQYMNMAPGRASFTSPEPFVQRAPSYTAPGASPLTSPQQEFTELGKQNSEFDAVMF